MKLIKWLVTFSPWIIFNDFKSFKDSHSSHQLIPSSILPFSYCLQADKTMMEEVILAGPDGVVGVDSYDPYCHQE